MLDRIVEEKWIRAHGVVGFFPASSVRRRRRALPRRRPHRGAHARCTTCASRGSTAPACPTGRCADFVAPQATPACADHVGAFAVTAGHGIAGAGRGVPRRARRLQRHPARVARRPAGRGVRRAPAPAGAHGVLGLRPRRARSTTTDLIDEQLRRHPPGARLSRVPRPHREAARCGSCSTWRRAPASSSPSRWRCGRAPRCAGWYFSHPQSQYFVVGRLGRDQVADYAERKGWTLAEAERWLSPNLGYDPED